MGKLKRTRSFASEQAVDHRETVEAQLFELVADAVNAGWSRTETLLAITEVAHSLARQKCGDGELEEVLAIVENMRG
ncbi:hypothetical protein [Neorhizobium sp. JUb45]|uniref:hypothetical protein n=1 Tax=Neorhizobium sp. JUb45 TaxID=2485113 RepID=UPI00104DA6CF|nr:hypothetical protein [Neorhizobium sp. JUb45]